jgi:hypothetical protein
MNRTRYRLPAILLICGAASFALQNFAPHWIWFVLPAGALAFRLRLSQAHPDMVRVSAQPVAAAGAI